MLTVQQLHFCMPPRHKRAAEFIVMQSERKIWEHLMHRWEVHKSARYAEEVKPVRRTYSFGRSIQPCWARVKALASGEEDPL